MIYFIPVLLNEGLKTREKEELAYKGSGTFGIRIQSANSYKVETKDWNLGL